MVTDHVGTPEIPITKEHPVQVVAGRDSLISVRMFIHKRGAPNSTDRAVGQLSIPVWHVLDKYGPSIYQTWFSLSDNVPYQDVPISQVEARYDHALQRVLVDRSAPRVCLSLHEAASDSA